MPRSSERSRGEDGPALCRSIRRKLRGDASRFAMLRVPATQAVEGADTRSIAQFPMSTKISGTRNHGDIIARAVRAEAHDDAALELTTDPSRGY